MPFSGRETPPTILLVDNGSLEAAATLGLRELAAGLAAAAGAAVEPVSLLHASAVPPAQLGGRPAEILEPALERRIATGARDFLILPLFFGPSNALTDYLPRRLAALQARYPHVRTRIAAPLVEVSDTGDERLAALLERRVRATGLTDGPSPPAVLLVDHGSPAPAVTRVREHLAGQLCARLGRAVRAVRGASMERRPEPAYDFNEPLLERALGSPGFAAGDVVVALLFFAPGRHAGPDGDVARICAAAARRHPGLRVTLTAPLGPDPGLIPLLLDRLRAAAREAMPPDRPGREA